MKTWLGALIASTLYMNFAYADIAAVQHNLKANFPDIPVQSVQSTPLNNIYEVYMGGQIVYTDETGNYFFVGNLIDNKNQKNLTEQSLQKFEKIDVSTLPLQQAIKHVKGNGKRTLYIFSDPDCPYCQRLEKELLQLDNVTIYLFLYPLKSLHPNAENIATRIWCASDSYSAWQNYLLRKQAPPSSTTCSNPIQSNLALGEKLNISGTPTSFLSNGYRITGAVSKERLDQMLDEVKAQ